MRETGQSTLMSVFSLATLLIALLRRVKHSAAAVETVADWQLAAAVTARRQCPGCLHTRMTARNA